MGCISSKPTVPPDPVPKNSPAGPVTLPVPASTSPQPDTKSSLAAPRSPVRALSAPHGEDLHSLPRVSPAPQPSKNPSSSSGPMAESNSRYGLSSTNKDNRPKRALTAPALLRAGSRTLTPTVHQVLSSCTKFRILIVGKKRSGKSSLIKTIFKVDTSVASGHINQDIHCDDNRYLVFHECSAFGPGDDQNLQRIRDFISNRTDPGCSTDERLHAVWICVPVADAVSGNIGEGVKEILDMNRVPVIVAFTKLDLAVAIEGGDSGRTNPRTQIEQSYRSLLDNGLMDVPAEIVSVSPKFSDLIHNLVATTDRLMTDSGAASAPSERRREQGEKSRIAPVPLVWSAALRVKQDIFIQASIEVGRSRYWRSLWTSLDFADKNLKECVNIIHTDIIEIWNLNDETGYLSDSKFKEKMSHIVGDLAVPVDRVPSSFDFNEWVYDVYRGSQENVQCVMGYIVDLTVILDDIFRIAAHNVSVNDIQRAVDRHMTPGRRDSIHGDVRRFVAEAFESRFKVTEGDLVLKEIIKLIKRYCATVL